MLSSTSPSTASPGAVTADTMASAPFSSRAVNTVGALLSSMRGCFSIVQQAGSGSFSEPPLAAPDPALAVADVGSGSAGGNTASSSEMDLHRHPGARKHGGEMQLARLAHAVQLHRRDGHSPLHQRCRKLDHCCQRVDAEERVTRRDRLLPWPRHPHRVRAARRSTATAAPTAGCARPACCRRG